VQAGRAGAGESFEALVQPVDRDHHPVGVAGGRSERVPVRDQVVQLLYSTTSGVRVGDTQQPLAQ
jgi:hypothetical protein